MNTFFEIIKYLLIVYNIFIIIGIIQEELKRRNSSNILLFIMSVLTITFIIIRR